MDHMDMGSSDSSSSSGMSMVFTDSQSTAFLSSAWVPDSTGAYAGTCIFLILLAIISRSLSAFRLRMETKWHVKNVNRRYIQVASDSASESAGPLGPAEKNEHATLTTNGLNEQVRILRNHSRGLEVPPWRFSTDLPRACISTVQVGVGYLLMLAVMTLNVGYFLSVLAGFFVGELVVGRYTRVDDGSH